MRLRLPPKQQAHRRWPGWISISQPRWQGQQRSPTARWRSIIASSTASQHIQGEKADAGRSVGLQVTKGVCRIHGVNRPHQPAFDNSALRWSRPSTRCANRKETSQTRKGHHRVISSNLPIYELQEILLSLAVPLLILLENLLGAPTTVLTLPGRPTSPAGSSRRLEEVGCAPRTFRAKEPPGVQPNPCTLATEHHSRSPNTNRSLGSRRQMMTKVTSITVIGPFPMVLVPSAAVKSCADGPSPRRREST